MYNNWATDFEVTKYVTWKTHKNLEETKKLLSGWEKSYENENCYRWVICIKETNTPIGTIDVVRARDEVETAEIGYCISRNYWGKGITTEACKEVIRFLFEEVKYNRLEAEHAVQNPASGRVMQKCGMTFEGIIRDGNRLNNGEFCDVKKYSILRREFCKEEI